MCTINDYDIIWILRYGAWWTEFSVILDRFLPFYPNNLKNENTAWRYHFTLVYTPQMTFTYMYVRYSSWDMKRDKKNILSFCNSPFTPLKTWKNQNFEKMKKKKKSQRYHHLTQMYQKSWSYARPFLRYDAWLILFYFGLFFCLF